MSHFLPMKYGGYECITHDYYIFLNKLKSQQCQ